MKKLKVLNIIFSSNEDFMNDLKGALSGNKLVGASDSISFDSFETFKRVMTSNKIEILMAIARLRPESINQLAKFINREFPHVLKDCRSLETLGFIKLIDSDGAKKQFAPRLIFDYDVIRVQSKFEKFLPITQESNNILKKSMAS